MGYIDSNACIICNPLLHETEDLQGTESAAIIPFGMVLSKNRIKINLEVKRVINYFKDEIVCTALSLIDQFL